MAELSARSGVPVATVKYYLRAGLLRPGVSTSATRSTYDSSHVQRLRLIRALVDIAGLSLGDVQRVLTAVDDESVSMHDAMGSAHSLLSSGARPSAAARERVDRVVESLGWRVAPDSPNRAGLAAALAALEDVEHALSDQTLRTYASSMHDVAEADLDTVPTADRQAAVHAAVVGTILVEPVLTALRRLAQEDVSGRRFGG